MQIAWKDGPVDPVGRIKAILQHKSGERQRKPDAAQTSKLDGWRRRRGVDLPQHDGPTINGEYTIQ
jgi:hypothetical protein